MPRNGRRRVLRALGALLALALTSVLLSTCASMPARQVAHASRKLSKEQARLVASARSLIGLPPNAKLIVKDRAFMLDCIGTVSAIFYGLDIDLMKDFARYQGDGVNRLYSTLRDGGVLHHDSYPRVGDVVIWDNSWDANADGKRGDDPRTHAGIVLAVDADGTIHYIHESVYRGVVIEVMNLLHPDEASDERGKRLNSGMAVPDSPGGPKPERWLAGQLFNSFGDALRMKDSLR